MIGGTVGLVAGVAGFLVLKRFAYTVVGKNKPALLFGILQPLIIIAVLICCAFFIVDQILFAGLAISSVIMGGSVITAVKSTVDRKRMTDLPGNNEEEAGNCE